MEHNSEGNWRFLFLFMGNDLAFNNYSHQHPAERENQMYVINETEIVTRAVLYNNRTISVVPPGFQMAISVTARRPDSQAQRTPGNKHTFALCAASMS
jgi:hypothetical protein